MTSCFWHSLKMFVALSTLIGFIRTAHADTSVASLGVRSQDGEDELERRLSGALRSSAKAVGGFAVADREQSLDQMLLAQGCDEPDAKCLTDISHTLSSEQLLYGSISEQNGAYELTLNLFDASSGKNETVTAHAIAPDLLSTANAEATLEKVLRRLLGRDQPAAASAGTLRLEGGIPGTAVTVDGVERGVIDDQGLLVMTLPAGEHRVQAGSEYSSEPRSATVEAGAQVTLSLAPVTSLPVEDERPPMLGEEQNPPPQHSSARLRRGIGYASIGVGVALAIATIYSWVRIEHINNDHAYKEYRAAFPKSGPMAVSNVCTQAKHHALAAQQNTTQNTLEDKANDLCNEASTLEALQYVFLGGAIVTGGVGTYLVLTARDKPKQPETTLSLRPRVSGQSAGLSATLAF